jgi:hypothetical protein
MTVVLYYALDYFFGLLPWLDLFLDLLLAILPGFNLRM